MNTTTNTTKTGTKEEAAAACRAYAAAHPGTVFHNYATHKCVRTADNRKDLYRWFKFSADYTRTRPELKGMWAPSPINDEPGAEVSSETINDSLHAAKMEHRRAVDAACAAAEAKSKTEVAQATSTTKVYETNDPRITERIAALESMGYTYFFAARQAFAEAEHRAVRAIPTPMTSNMVPMTGDEAVALYQSNGRRPFSFVYAPHDVLKTLFVSDNRITAMPPAAAREFYLSLSRVSGS